MTFLEVLEKTFGSNLLRGICLVVACMVNSLACLHYNVVVYINDVQIVFNFTKLQGMSIDRIDYDINCVHVSP